MSWSDSQSKKLIDLKCLILEIPFPQGSVSILVLSTINFCFEVLTTATAFSSFA